MAWKFARWKDITSEIYDDAIKKIVGSLLSDSWFWEEWVNSTFRTVYFVPCLQTSLTGNIWMEEYRSLIKFRPVCRPVSTEFRGWRRVSEIVLGSFWLSASRDNIHMAFDTCTEPPYGPRASTACFTCNVFMYLFGRECHCYILRTIQISNNKPQGNLTG